MDDQCTLVSYTAEYDAETILANTSIIEEIFTSIEEVAMEALKTETGVSEDYIDTFVTGPGGALEAASKWCAY